MPNTLTYTGRLVVTSCWCGIHLAVPEDLYSLARRKENQGIYCPLGHVFVFGDTLEEQLAEAKKQLNATKHQRDATRALLRHEERSHAATRGHVTRKKKELSRVKAGVCPCCSRTFQNLQRHMAGQHPDFTP